MPSQLAIVIGTAVALDLGADRGLGAMVAIQKERGLDPWLAGSLTDWRLFAGLAVRR
jgi:hypothetical protein